MRRSRFYCLLLGLLLGGAGCVARSPHGLVDARTLRRLDTHAISKKEFQEQLSSPALLASLRPAQTHITLPFRLVSGTPVIEASLGEGRPIEMMLDTGAARVMMNARVMVRNHMPVVRSDEAQVTMLGVAGTEQGRLGILRPLHLGTWQMLGYPCFIRTHENRLGSAQFPQNILGFDLPSRVCSYLTLDYPKRTVTFAFADSFAVKNNVRNASAPFRIINGVPFIQTESKGIRWTTLVDTGSFNGIEIDEAVAKKLGVQDQGRLVKGLYLAAVGGTLSSDHARLRTVTLPEIRLLGGKYPQAEVDISPGLPRLGSFFLKDYRVTFDFRRKRLWLEW